MNFKLINFQKIALCTDTKWFLDMQLCMGFFFFDIFINTCSKVIEKEKGQFITISNFLSFEELNAIDTCHFERAYKITCDWQPQNSGNFWSAHIRRESSKNKHFLTGIFTLQELRMSSQSALNPLVREEKG